MTSMFSAWRTDGGHGRLRLADILQLLTTEPLPFRFTAYDGSTAGPSGSAVQLHLRTPRGAAYLATAPGSLGMARAYVSGDLEVTGIHPGDPYPLLADILGGVCWHKPDAVTVARIARGLGVSRLVPPTPPPQEALPDWRRALEGLRHSRKRDADAIHHHYDVSNHFYEMVLGPSMTYTCACYPTADSTHEEAQEHKYDQVARKIGLRPGMRLLDVGCGWGGMVRHAAKHYGAKALGVTLSKEQASWASEAIAREGLSELAEVRHLDYRDVPEGDFDAISSIGLTEHIGVRNYPSYFRFLHGKLRPGGRLLNHSITRPDNVHQPRVVGGFIDRYVFPDGELTGSSPRCRTWAGRCATRRTCASTTPSRSPRGAATCRTTGTPASVRWVRGRRGSGACTWQAHDWASSATGCSYTRCSRSSCTPTAPPTTRCGTRSGSDRSPPLRHPRRRVGPSPPGGTVTVCPTDEVGVGPVVSGRGRPAGPGAG
jgi:cyclopropane-fatty-acyl-phospholipid synthase